MEPGSLIGFFLVLIAATWSLSVIAAIALRLLARRLRSAGPAAEKRAASMAIIAPVVGGGLVTAAIAGYSFLGPDHCGAHGHHLHLCLFHGGAWAGQLSAVVACAAIAGLFAARAARLATTLIDGHRRLRIIARSSRPQAHRGAAVFVAPSDTEFCFAAGLVRPRIYISSSLWRRLDADKLDAVIGHEIAHIDNRDLWRSTLLSVAAIVSPPLCASRLRSSWDSATERLCDRIAADRVGDEVIVAEALLSWARGARLAGAMSFSPSADELSERVVAILSEQSAGHNEASRLARAGAFLFVAGAIAAVVLADPLHHGLETVFGLGAGI